MTSPFTMRPYQSVAVAELRRRLAALRSSSRRGRILLVSPTGSGKTLIFSEIIRSATGKGSRILFLAGSKEIIDQTSEKLDALQVDHGVIMADHPRRRPTLPVQVASVLTLIRRDLPPADLIIVDEADLARAESYAKILDAYPVACVLGATATPWRLDGRGLGELFDDIYVAATPRELTAQGYLVPFTGWAFDAPDLSGVRRSRGEFDAGDLEEAITTNRRLAGNIVTCYQQRSAGRRAVVFAVSIAHSQALAERFRAAGVAAEHLDGAMGRADREGVLARLRSGATSVVTNVGVLTRGVDIPALEVAIFARPTLSLSLFLQMAGRVLRPSPETGKTIARIHDHAGNCLRHGLPSDDRDFSLTRDVSKKRAAAEPVQSLTTCRECFAIFASTEPCCPLCGAVRTPTRREIREIENATAIPLENLPRGPGADRVEGGYLAALLRKAEAAGYKQGWVAFRFKARFHRFPSAVQLAAARRAVHPEPVIADPFAVESAA